MANIKRCIIVCFVVMGLLVGTVQAAELVNNHKLDKIEVIMQIIKEKYYKEISEEQIINSAIKGITDALDPHSKYFTDEELEAFINDVSGNYVGIGISFIKDGKYLNVQEVFEDSPAYKAGIRKGDKIFSVNGENLETWTSEDAANKIKGTAGTTVKLGVASGDITTYIDITREEVKLSPVTYSIKSDVGYIRISSFNENTDAFVARALEYFDEQKTDKIIIDLRDNTGGILEQAVYVAGHFVPKGVVVSIQERDKEAKSYYSNLEQAKYKVAVIVNEMTASASEVLAGAIQDYKCGTIIGTKTYGKGTVQKVYYLNDGGALKLTISNYYTPNNRIITGEGITPDIIINDSRNGIDIDDIQLLTCTVKPNLGEEGIDVYNAERMLKLAGYDIDEPDMLLDEKTFEAIKKFQGDSGLGVYGRLDFTTQKSLNKKFEEIKENKDVQLLKAIEVLGK